MSVLSRVGVFAVFHLLLLHGTLVLAAPQLIKIGNSVEPRELDPHRSVGIPEMNILLSLFEGLVSYDPRTGKATPGVAEKWTTSKDQMKWTFTLRKDAKWSNGEPVTASDFVYSWTRLLNPANANEYAYFGFFIKNGEKFNKRELTDASKLGLKAIDPHTFEVELEKPTPYLLKLAFFPSLFPVHQASMEKFGKKWQSPENIVTNGAFVLTKWEINNVIVLKPNPNYWDKKSVTLEEAQFFPTENQFTEENMFRRGQLHVTFAVPVERVAFWRKDQSGSFHSDPLLSDYHVKFNTTKAPFNDKRVRRAFALAVDRKQLVERVTLGNEMPALAFVPPGTGGYEPKKYLPSGLEKLNEAKELLKAAGYGPGKPFPKVTYIYNTSEANKKIAETLQSMWKKNLGLDIEIQNQEWKVYLNTMSRLDFQLLRARWGADYDDPNTFLDLFLKDGGNNNTGFENAKYDQLIAESSKLPDGAKRMSLFAQAEDILMDELPIIPLYIEKKNYLKAKNIEGWYPNPLSYYYLKYVKVK